MKSIGIFYSLVRSTPEDSLLKVNDFSVIVASVKIIDVAFAQLFTIIGLI